jgi:hypothetical protein
MKGDQLQLVACNARVIAIAAWALGDHIELVAFHAKRVSSES